MIEISPLKDWPIQAIFGERQEIGTFMPKACGVATNVLVVTYGVTASLAELGMAAESYVGRNAPHRPFPTRFAVPRSSDIGTWE